MQKKLLKKLVEKSIKASFEGGSLDKRKALKYTELFRKMSLAEAIFMLNLYSKGIRREADKHIMLVESATDLSPAQLKEIKGVFNELYTIYDIQYTKNASLLGGIKVKIGDVLIDDSVKSKIGQVKEVISV